MKAILLLVFIIISFVQAEHIHAHNHKIEDHVERIESGRNLAQHLDDENIGNHHNGGGFAPLAMFCLQYCKHKPYTQARCND
jgi:hypothetical protein